MKEPATQIETAEALLRKASAPSSPVLSTRPAGHPILQLQRTIGNQAVQRLIRRQCSCGGTPGPTGECEECSKKNQLGLQTDLKVNEPGDIYEQEADRIADQVKSAKPVGIIPRKCAAFAEGTIWPKGRDEERVQPKEKPAARSPGLTSAPPIVHEVLRSAGQPLGTTERAFMEPRFGQDFSGVRVHTGAKAAESAAAVQARAYTVGNNIVFGGNESASDLPVLAHELAHVVQQSGASPAVQRLTFCRDFLDATERAGVAEHRVRDHLANQAKSFGKVVTELPIPEATAAPQRTEKKKTEITPFIAGERGSVDVALLIDSRLELLEVKKATWEWDGATFAEVQLERYLRRARENRDIVTTSWRRKSEETEGTSSTDQITSIEPMPMKRLLLWPNPIPIGGVNVLLRWCDEGLVVFKVEPDEEEEPKDKEPKDKEPGPSEPLLEQLLTLGMKIAPLLGAAWLLDIALAMAGVLGSIVTSPLLALAAVVLGIAFFWDKLEWLGSKIAGMAQWVWDRIAGLAGWVRGKLAWFLGKLHELGIKLAELGSWLAGKIAWLAGKLAEGLSWIAGKIAAGGRWVGRKIASAAEAIWDWLWGSDVEPLYPIIDIPITEESWRHCTTVAYEDTVIKLDADLLFPFNEWKLKPEPEAQAPLEKAAAKSASMLQKDDWIKFEGHTDVIGSNEYNQTLSEQRAGAVASWFVEWFVKHGVVPMPKVRIEGYGKTMAKAPANDEEGRQKDRRVEVWLPKHGGTRKVCW